MLRLGGSQHSEINILPCRNRLKLANQRTHILIGGKEKTHIMINPHKFDCILILGANVSLSRSEENTLGEIERESVCHGESRCNYFH